MKTFGVLFLVIWVSMTKTSVVTVQDNQTNVVRLNETIKFGPRLTEPLFSTLGIANGVRQCGNARSLQWRLESCQSPLPGPCILPLNKFQRGEVTFIASESASAVGLLITTMDATNDRKILGQWKNSNFPSSWTEAMNAVVALGSDLQGKLITQQLSFYRESDQQVEACFEAEFLII